MLIVPFLRALFVDKFKEIEKLITVYRHRYLGILVLNPLRFRGQQEQVQSRSLNMFSKSILMVSRIVFTDDYTCRRHVHVALLKKLNRLAPKAADRPDLKLIEEFYQRIYPNGIGYPEMSPNLDGKFGWSLTSLLKKCLDISPAHRFSAREIVEFLVKESRKESSLSKYKLDLESDL